MHFEWRVEWLISVICVILMFYAFSMASRVEWLISVICVILMFYAFSMASRMVDQCNLCDIDVLCIFNGE